jgi:hypothetical protein
VIGPVVFISRIKISLFIYCNESSFCDKINGNTVPVVEARFLPPFLACSVMLAIVLFSAVVDHVRDPELISRMIIPCHHNIHLIAVWSDCFRC